MRKITLTFIISIFTVLNLTTNIAKAEDDTGWVIENFDSDITVNRDTSVDVVETIQVDFQRLQKHGIYREIPVHYKTNFGNNYKINLNLKSVTDIHGNVLQTDVTKQGDDINIRIGDPNQTVTGNQTYVISYSADRVVKEGEDAGEFYWNVTGNGWPVPIFNTSTKVHSPTGILDTICFTGNYSSVESNCTHSTVLKTASYTAGILAPYEGLTISAKLDSSGLIFPSYFQKFTWFFRDNWVYLTPLVVFTVMFMIYWRRGRDRKYKNIFHDNEDYYHTLPFERLSRKFTFHPPKDLSPGEVGVIVDENVHDRDIAAIAIDLARRGFFNIIETEKGKIFKKIDFKLSCSGKEESQLHSFEKKVLELFFGNSRNKGAEVDLSKMPTDAYKVIKSVRDELYNHLTQEGYFVGNPDTVRKKFIGISSLITLIAILFINLLGGSGNSTGIIFSIVISGLIILAFSFVMPARSPKGRKALESIVGLREYVKIGAWRQKKFESWGYFEEILPYAIAFDLTHKYINAFKDAKIPQPNWYQSKGAFNPIYFSNSVSNFSSSMASGVKATAPKSSSGSGFGGGGFSGGGMGGGGGGSW